jgi:hypothetical protein
MVGERPRFVGKTQIVVPVLAPVGDLPIPVTRSAAALRFVSIGPDGDKYCYEC